MLFSSWPVFCLQVWRPQYSRQYQGFAIFTIKVIFRDISRSYIFAEIVFPTPLPAPTPLSAPAPAPLPSYIAAPGKDQKSGLKPHRPVHLLGGHQERGVFRNDHHDHHNH